MQYGLSIITLFFAHLINYLFFPKKKNSLITVKTELKSSKGGKIQLSFSKKKNIYFLFTQINKISH